jgi:hypothetical protein
VQPIAHGAPELEPLELLELLDDPLLDDPLLLPLLDDPLLLLLLLLDDPLLSPPELSGVPGWKSRLLPTSCLSGGSPIELVPSGRFSDSMQRPGSVLLVDATHSPGSSTAPPRAQTSPARHSPSHTQLSPTPGLHAPMPKLAKSSAATNAARPNRRAEVMAALCTPPTRPRARARPWADAT